MKLTALRLHNIRRFQGRGIAIEGMGDGINVLSAANEAGKSTCFDALHALFFQPHSSSAASIHALRPYSGGNTLVEADIVTKTGAFRVKKQFHGKKQAMVLALDTGRIIAQADEAERFIANLVQGGTGGPAGLLWVRQGMTGLERRARSDEEGEKRARESLLTSVQGEVETLTGGRRMAQALAACGAERERLVTATGRPKAGGAYALALEERNRLAQEEAERAAEVTKLRAALDERRSLAARLADLENPETRLADGQALHAAEAALAKAKAQGEALTSARLVADLAQNQQKNAQAAFDMFLQNRARLSGLATQLKDALKKRDDTQTGQRQALEAEQQAGAAVEAAEREEREARALLARLDLAMKARAAHADLARLRETEARVSALRSKVETLTAEIKALNLPEQAIKALEALENRLITLKAEQAARVPQLRVAYEPGREGSVALHGVPLAEGVETALPRHVVLEIIGIGQLTLTQPSEAEGQAALAKSVAQRDAALKTLGLASLAEVRLRENILREKHAERAFLNQEIALLAPEGLAALQGVIALRAAEAGAAEEIKADPVAVQAALEAAETRVIATRAAARQVQAPRDDAQKALVSAEGALATISAEHDALLAGLGDEAAREAKEAILLASLKDAKAAYEAAEAKRADHAREAVDLAAIEARYQRLSSVEAGKRIDITQLREAIATLNGAIKSRADEAVEELWQEAREKLAGAEARVAAFEEEVALLNHLHEALEAAKSAAREHYFAPVMRELRPLLGLLFEDASVRFDEATLLPSSISRNGLEEEVGVLSGGMREQLAILTRLAFARLLAQDAEPTPVILDDALVYSDDDRIERMFDALHRQAGGQQIIVFSCRQRAFSKLGGTVLHMVPWNPDF